MFSILIPTCIQRLSITKDLILQIIKTNPQTIKDNLLKIYMTLHIPRLDKHNAKIIEELSYIKEIKIIYPKNTHISKNLNIMLTTALHENISDELYLIKIDDDTYPLENDWLNVYREVYNRIPGVGVLYSCKTLTEIYERLLNNIGITSQEKSGMLMFFNRKIINKLGGFQELLDPYGNEDLDFLLRSELSGLNNYGVLRTGDHGISVKHGKEVYPKLNSCFDKNARELAQEKFQSIKKEYLTKNRSTKIYLE